LVTQIASMLGLVGADFTAPETLAEFFPWFFSALLAFCMIAGILQMIRWVCMAIVKGGRSL